MTDTDRKQRTIGGHATRLGGVAVGGGGGVGVPAPKMKHVYTLFGSCGPYFNRSRVEVVWISGNRSNQRSAVCGGGGGGGSGGSAALRGSGNFVGKEGPLSSASRCGKNVNETGWWCRYSAKDFRCSVAANTPQFNTRSCAYCEKWFIAMLAVYV